MKDDPEKIINVRIEQLNFFQELVLKFLDYADFELELSPETIAKYKESLRWAERYMKDIHSPTEITKEHIFSMKRQMKSKGLSANRMNSIIFSLRIFLNYCNNEEKLNTINFKDITPMKVPKRQVTYLKKEEVEEFLNSINTKDIRGLRIRTLTELLLATGMRISECLSINKEDVDWENKEIVIIGKGNKQRTVFLTDRSINWLRMYLLKRTDNNPALFVTFGDNKRLTRFDLSKQFRRHSKNLNIKTKLHPHLFRHTMATWMLHSGADITFIQAILGHSNIQTTAQYYLGTDKQAIKEAHNKYLRFD